jgi:putative membrane protein
MILSRLLAGVALAALMAQPAVAQSTTSQPQQPMATSQSQELAQQDMEFATKAAGDGMAEVKLGELAQQQAEREEVRQFGQQMVDDHSEANQQLMSIAQAKGIELPQQLPDEAQQLYDELRQETGRDFDRAYIDAMVEDHQKAVELFEQEASSGQDAELKSFAEATLPTLQDHLERALQTQEQVTAANAPGTGGGAQPAASGAMAGGSMSGDQQQSAQAPAGVAVQASDVIGAEVVNDQGDAVGEIMDLVIDDQKVEYAVVSVGGFLGIGDKEVAVPLDQLKLGADEAYLMSGATEDQLKQMPAYDEGRYQRQG